MQRSLFHRYAPTIVGLALAIGAQAAAAATTTANFLVSASVNAACQVSATNLAFGVYNQTAGANTDATSTVTVNCTTGIPYNVGLSAGSGTGATVANRVMEDENNNLLNYTLYRDSSRVQVWGETIGTNTVSGTGNGAGQTLTAYGRIFADQSDTAPTGSYDDTVTATITY
jgi:spore coat protein U-like protein